MILMKQSETVTLLFEVNCSLHLFTKVSARAIHSTAKSLHVVVVYKLIPVFFLTSFGPQKLTNWFSVQKRIPGSVESLKKCLDLRVAKYNLLNGINK